MQLCLNRGGLLVVVVAWDCFSRRRRNSLHCLSDHESAHNYKELKSLTRQKKPCWVLIESSAVTAPMPSHGCDCCSTRKKADWINKSHAGMSRTKPSMTLMGKTGAD